MAPLPANLSTVSRPSTRAIKKHTAAPAMALDQDSIAPCHQPNIAAFAKVIRNAGRGAATDENTIRKKDMTMAYGP